MVQFRSSYGQRLYQARLRKGLTQRQVEKEVGISQSNLGELEHKGSGSAFTVALALLYEVNPVWLAMGTGPMEGVVLQPKWLEPLTDSEFDLVKKFAETLVSNRVASAPQ